MEKYLKSECTVNDLIDCIVELEENIQKCLNDVTKSYEARDYKVKEYVIEDRVSAMKILKKLEKAACEYGIVTAADYYELIGAESILTDNCHGWTCKTITQACIVPRYVVDYCRPSSYIDYGLHAGYIIKFPPVEVI
jgi:hypothetical protein